MRITTNKNQIDFNHEKTVFLICAICCLFCSCKKAAFINPSKMALTFPIQGGEFIDTIHSDGKWEVAICPDWVTVEIQDDVMN